MRKIVILVGMAAVCLAGCDRIRLSERAAHGRYVGVGIYSPSAQWTKMAEAETASPDEARLADDEVVIVVADSQTGEVRACGDLSGYCIGMNPWRAPLPNARHSPVDLSAHMKAPRLVQPDTNSADNEAR
jgi:hypothetical protein